METTPPWDWFVVLKADSTTMTPWNPDFSLDGKGGRAGLKPALQER